MRVIRIAGLVVLLTLAGAWGYYYESLFDDPIDTVMP